MFSGSIYFLVASLALVSGQITPDHELPLLMETSSTVNPEMAHDVPQEDESVFETTEELKVIDITPLPSSSELQELGPDGVPMVPFFSDLAGAFGAHRLLAKRSLRALEPQRGDFQEKTAWYRIFQESKGYPLVEPTEGINPSEECVDRNTKDCNFLASKGYCDISWTISLPTMMKMCSNTCKFCQITPDSKLSLSMEKSTTQYPEKTFVLPHDVETVEQAKYRNDCN